MTRSPSGKPGNDSSLDKTTITLELLTADRRGGIEAILLDLSGRFRKQVEACIEPFFAGVEGGEGEERRVLKVARADILPVCDGICTLINNILFRSPITADLASASRLAQANLGNQVEYIDELRSLFTKIHLKAAALIDKFVKSVQSEGSYATDISDGGAFKADLREILQIMNDSKEHIQTDKIEGRVSRVVDVRNEFKDRTGIVMPESLACSQIIQQEVMPQLADAQNPQEAVKLLILMMQRQIDLMSSGVSGQKITLLDNFHIFSEARKVMILLNTLQEVLLGIESLVKIEDILGKQKAEK